MNLASQLEDEFRLDQKQKRALRRLKLFSVADLLFHLPARYSDISTVMHIANLKPGMIATVYGKVSSVKTKKGFRSGTPMAQGKIEDASGKIKIIWFNQAYLAKMIHEGENVKLTGKVTQSGDGIYLANPEFEKVADMPIDTHDTLFANDKQGKDKNSGLSYPVYNETRGITSKWFYHTLEKVFKNKVLDEVADYIPSEILKKYNLPTLKTALVWVHKPKDKRDAESARKRFAFEEIFFIQLERQHDKMEFKKHKSFQIKTTASEIKKFIAQFPAPSTGKPFKATKAQNTCIKTILSDMKRDFPMSRLLEGDVGSGKTAVAATASYAVVTTRPKGQDFGNLQVAYMAPTEILASQHFESFIEYFNKRPQGGNPATWTPHVQVGLITGSGCRKFPSKSQVFTPASGGTSWTNISRAQLLKWVANGEIPILIGTHSLIQKTVKFKNLALVVIDEQHRFGTAQRGKLAKKGGTAPHLLSMTATPIPRTLALTIYGDLDLSLLDEMPAGRKQIITEIIKPGKREQTYAQIREELKAGRQLYVICPRIFEPDPEKELALNVKSAVAEAKRLKRDVFPEYETGVLHSKMTKIKKEGMMKNFSEGKIDILCATSVVEVGVNVPNATMIVIEGAERFGLAQLHQLRGRVQRSSHQAYCYIFAEAKSEKTISRLKALQTAKNGFELAELDLTLRGAGDLVGTKQWGITDLGMEAIKNIKMVEAARTEATALIEKDPELKKYPLLKQKVHEKVAEFHFE